MTESVIKVSGGILTNASQLILNNLSASVFKYEIVFSGLSAVTGSQTDLVFQTSINNGASFAGGSAEYANRLIFAMYPSGDNTYYTSYDTEAHLINALSNTTGDFVSGTIEIFNPMNALLNTNALTRCGGRINANSNTTNPAFEDMWNRREVLEANNAIKIYVTSGNFNMQYTVYAYLIDNALSTNIVSGALDKSRL